MARPRKLSTVAAEGDRLDTLCTLRDRLARDIDATDSARDSAALGRLFADVLAQIDALAHAGAVTSEDNTFDEIAKRRSARGANTDRIVGTAGGIHG
jgi:hypothetical protein